MRRWHRLGLSMLVLACALTGAKAQNVSLSPSAALGCMTPPAAERGLPVYPAKALARKEGVTLRVELAFAGPDAMPALRVLDTHVVGDAFLDAVRDHVQRLRVPCMSAGGEPVRLVQTYVFRPDDGRPVMAMPPRDLAEAQRQAQRKCLTRITPDELPDYPTVARLRDEEGNFLVRLRFASPDEPPAAEIVAGPSNRWFRESLSAYAAGYRLPCQQGEPASLDILFHFRIDGGPRTVIKDMALRQFLGLARHIPPARFDLRTMGCPFDLRVTHKQPFAEHAVGQIGEARPERADFIAWLAQVQLKLDERTALDVLGDHFTVSVPCATLDL